MASLMQKPLMGLRTTRQVAQKAMPLPARVVKTGAMGIPKVGGRGIIGGHAGGGQVQEVPGQRSGGPLAQATSALLPASSIAQHQRPSSQ